MPVVKATVKGQILIPAEIRKKLKIGRGTKLNIYDDGDKIIVEPLKDDPVKTGAWRRSADEVA